MWIIRGSINSRTGRFQTRKGIQKGKKQLEFQWLFPVRFPNIVTLQAFTSKDQMMEPAMHQTFLFHIFVSIYPSFGACPLSPCTHFVSFSCGLWSIKLSRSIRLRRFIARRLASRFDRTRRLGRGLPGAVLEKVVGAVDNGRKTPKKPCLTWTWTLSSSGFRSRLFRVRSRKQMQPVYNSENTKAHCCSSGVPSFECGYDPQLTTSGSTDLLRIGMNRISVGRSHLNLFEVSLRGRGRGRGWERAECWNVLAALAAHSERDLKDLKLSRKKVRIFWSKSAANACCRVPFGKRWAYTPGRSESSPRRASEKKTILHPFEWRGCNVVYFFTSSWATRGRKFQKWKAYRAQKECAYRMAISRAVALCRNNLLTSQSFDISPHVLSPLFLFSTFFQLISFHVFSPLLSFFQLLPALLSWSQVFSSRVSSSSLFSAHLNPSLFSSSQLRSSQGFPSSSYIISAHLNSPQLFSGPKPAPRLQKVGFWSLFKSKLKGTWRTPKTRKHVKKSLSQITRIPQEFIWSGYL